MMIAAPRSPPAIYTIIYILFAVIYAKLRAAQHHPGAPREREREVKLKREVVR